MWFKRPDINQMEAEGNLQGLIKALTHRNTDINGRASKSLSRLFNTQNFDLPLPAFPANKQAKNRLLESMGLLSGPAVPPTEKLVTWLPEIVKAIEEMQFQPLPYSKYDKRCEIIEGFFSGLCFEKALPYLHYALQSKLVTVIGEPSQRVVDEKIYEDTWEDAGSVGSVYKVSGTVTIKVIEYVYECKNPIADGAKRAAMSLKASSPELASQIDNLLRHYGGYYPKEYKETREDGATYDARSYTKIPGTSTSRG